MTGLQSWAITVCLAALAAGMAGIVAPHGPMEKVYKFAVALFFLCCVLTPLFGLKSIRLSMGNSQFSVSGTSSVTAAVNSQITAQTQQAMTSLVTQTFEKYGTSPLSVQVAVTTDSAGTVSVGNVTTVLKKADYSRAESLRRSVENDLGMRITIREGET